MTQRVAWHTPLWRRAEALGGRTDRLHAGGGPDERVCAGGPPVTYLIMSPETLASWGSVQCVLRLD